MPDFRALVADWEADPETALKLAHVTEIPERQAIFADPDPPLNPVVQNRLLSLGVELLWRHQARAIEAVRASQHTVVVAGTAAGKSLCYLVPIAEAIAADSKRTFLCVYPTKALAQDQLRAIEAMGFPGLLPATYHGDTEPSQRAWIRRNANLILTNPDMLHFGILPNHARWRDFLHRLTVVVVDELHTLRGVFGSHVALILRRLRRLAVQYQASPTFVFASATIANPAELATALIGTPVRAIEEDASPIGARTFVAWNPPLEIDRRASALGEATDLLVELLGRGATSIVFARSRKATELIYRWARERVGPELAPRLAAYRAGYLPADRRRIEAGLAAGDLLGVVTTNALELGVDIGGLDASILTTYPGTIASFRQQTGRAGRRQRDSLGVLVAGEDALDQYFMRHPEQLFARPAEAAVVNPTNPHVLDRHLGCAAAEAPLVPEDRDFFGEEIEEAAARLVAAGRLRLRGGALHWAERGSPARQIDIRSTGDPIYTVVLTETGEVLGTLEEGKAFTQAHAGAVYLHQGDTYTVEALDLLQHQVRVRSEEVAYYTQSKVEQWVGLLSRLERRPLGRFWVGSGMVEVERQVIAYQRRDVRSRTVLGLEPLDLPPRRFTTQGFWLEVPEALLEEAKIDYEQIPGALHAAEHASIGMLPLLAICDRSDVGGLSTPHHPDIGGPVWFVYDGFPGGAGIAPIGFAGADRLLRSTLEAIAACPCEVGCPSCVQSPKCGNYNEPLDKQAAADLLRLGLG